MLITKESILQVEAFENKVFCDLNLTNNDISVVLGNSEEKPIHSDLTSAKTSLLKFLETHHLPAKVTGEVITVLDVNIEPPYISSSCNSTNTITLNKIQKLLNDFYQNTIKP
eukprot:TRINITY_DN12128_c0_g1_i1.p1 TRINITY_DN12128_c0_g1~~TRINITY_DN12128_c0_g1_i1.p1  ORF type:complete len:112 (-),score=10.19 TRINITY_DN12128_c0_g1_i1:116-451(-)